MGRQRGIVSGGAVALAAVFAFAACGSSGHTPASGGTAATGGSGTGSTISSSSGTVTSGTITIGTTLAPTTLDPATGDSGTGYQYLYFLFDRLIQSNPHTGALEPMLATSWSFSPNKLSLTVNLRHGVRFQDGTPFDAQAVVQYSKEYIKDGDIVDDLENVTSVTANGLYQVVYHLSHQNSGQDLRRRGAGDGPDRDGGARVGQAGRTRRRHPR
jgi:ABC-type transport system substrate-binding protein